jgi:hypothetical protein
LGFPVKDEKKKQKKERKKRRTKIETLKMKEECFGGNTKIFKVVLYTTGE